MSLTKRQQEVLDKLRSGWRIECGIRRIYLSKPGLSDEVISHDTFRALRGHLRVVDGAQWVHPSHPLAADHEKRREEAARIRQEEEQRREREKQEFYEVWAQMIICKVGPLPTPDRVDRVRELLHRLTDAVCLGNYSARP